MTPDREELELLRQDFLEWDGRREELGLRAIRALRSDAHLRLGMEAIDYLTYAFPSSRSMRYRLETVAQHLKHLEFAEIEKLPEGHRYELGRAHRAMGVCKKTKELTALAATGIENLEFHARVEEVIYHPDQHRERYVALGVRLKSSTIPKVEKAIAKIAECLTLDLEHDNGAEDICYAEWADAIEATTMGDLKIWLRGSE